MHFILIVINIFIVITLFSLQSTAHNKIVFCYYASSTFYRQIKGKFDVSDIDPNLCTHIGYSFVGVSDDGSVLIFNTETTYISESFYNLEHLIAMKKNHRNLKTILSIDGRQKTTINFSDITQSYNKIQRFIHTTVLIMDTYEFDGLDINWEYPSDPIHGGIPEDKNNFNIFLQMIKIVLNKKNYTLSAAVAAQEAKAKIYYDIPEMHKYLDFINLKTYNFYGTWNGKTSFHSPLEGTVDPQLNVIAAVEYWLKKGVPSYKLVLGISFYGQTFELKNKTDNGVDAEILDAGSPNLVINDFGIYAYPDICLMVRNNILMEKFNERMKSTYAYNEHFWISYENKKSIYHKINYVKWKNLAGVMIWSIDADDCIKVCAERFPLLKSIHLGLNNKMITSELNRKNDMKKIKQQQIVKLLDDEIFICPGTGLFAKQSYCKDFHVCTEAGDTQTIVMSCPTGLLFDKKIGKCNWPTATTCEDDVYQRFST